MAADLMSGFLDFNVGALITFMLAETENIPIKPIHLFIGGICALLPDIDVIILTIQSMVRNRSMTGDHRETIFHRPLIMIPILVVFGYVFGGTFWAIIVVLCLLWHYIHDSHWMSVGDIHWFWPITKRKALPYMDHPAWREKYWLQPSLTSLVEIGVASFIFRFLVSQYAPDVLAIIVVLVIWTTVGCVWFL